MRALRRTAAIWVSLGLLVAGFSVTAAIHPTLATVTCDRHCGDHHHDDGHDRQDSSSSTTETVTEERTSERTVTEHHTSTETVHDGSHSTNCAGLVSACDVATVTVDAQRLLQQNQSH